MKMLGFTSIALATALLATSTMASADSRVPPPPPPSAGGDGYGSDYGSGYGNDSSDAYQGAPQAGYGSRQGDYDAGARDQGNNDAKLVGGALLGGAGGAVAGTFIAGHGARLAGGLVGGGIGAVAGLALGSLLTSNHNPPSAHNSHSAAPSMGYDYGVTDSDVMYHGHWAGTMTGSWNGAPPRTWQGTFDSDNGQTHWRGRYVNEGAGYGPRPYPGRPMGFGRGYGYGAQMYEEVLVPAQPIITQTVTTRSYYVDVPVRTYHYVKRTWRPHYCGCTIVRPRAKWRPQPKPAKIMGS